MSLTSFKIPINQMSYETVLAKLLYSASAELLETVVCFLAFHETNELPTLIIYPVTDFLVRGHIAQSTSQYAEIFPSELLAKSKP